ncbi:MAG TPA: adenylate/guanylate cyclase domain-containing protein [Dongiaceae bacterium]|nr:adenylate/guanylate cyclase domain-containing protein [Dongiaceae bacterium]
MTVMPSTTLADTIEWLNDSCPGAESTDLVLPELCGRLIGHGVPLAYGGIFIRTLHPEIMGRRFIWRPGMPVEATSVGYDLFDDPEYRGSPIAWVFANGERLRRRLGDPDCPNDFTFLDRFRADGATDLVISPLRYSGGEVHVAAWMTQLPGGFPDHAVAMLHAIERPVARMAEIRTLKRIAVNLLDTYVGGQAGGRILGGHIRRGDIEAIRAAIWLSDMRGFTARADRMPPADLVELLNRYFDCQVPAIREAGGEVLKFMGDGLLAIFPVGDAGEAAVCRAVLSAARTIEAAIAGADWGGLEAPGGMKFGVALHVGEVMYGNVGSVNRLDFTCIGPAVNLAARIEKLSGEIGRTILASADFARHCGDAHLAPLGAFALKGVAAEQTVYGLA